MQIGKHDFKVLILPMGIKNKLLMRTFLNLLKGLFLFFCVPYFVWKQKKTTV